MVNKIKSAINQFLNNKKAMAGLDPDLTPENLDMGGLIKKKETRFSKLRSLLRRKKRLEEQEEEHEEQEGEEEEEKEEKEIKNRKKRFGISLSGLRSPAKSATSNLTAGLTIIFIGLIFDIMAFSLGNLGIAVHIVAFLVFYFGFLKGDSLAALPLGVKLLGLISTSVPIIGNDVNTWINILPVWFIYTGFFRNERKGKLTTLVFIGFVVAFGAVTYDLAKDNLAEAAENLGLDIDQEFGPEERELASTTLGRIGGSIKDTSVDLKNAILGIPKGIGNLINPKIAQAGGKDILGKSEQSRPQLGIVIKNHPSINRFTEDDKLGIKALIVVPAPLEGKTFITITDVKCWPSNDKLREKSTRPLEIADELQNEGVKIFYDREQTITCPFAEEDLKGTSSVMIAVDYEVGQTVRLSTYIMRADRLEDLLIDGTDPLDDMEVPFGKRNPVPLFPRGPAKLGIGPVELWNPPLAVGEGSPKLRFEFAIFNNRADFNGIISSLDKVIITMPRGMTLGGEECLFKPTAAEGIYETTVESKIENPNKFKNIKTSRLFDECTLEVNSEAALQGGPHIDVEFRADVAFTYAAEKKVSFRKT